MLSKPTTETNLLHFENGGDTSVQATRSVINRTVMVVTGNRRFLHGGRGGRFGHRNVIDIYFWREQAKKIVRENVGRLGASLASKRILLYFSTLIEQEPTTIDRDKAKDVALVRVEQSTLE